MPKFIILIVVALCVSFSQAGFCAGKSTSKQRINQIGKTGKREGYWVLTEYNKPTGKDVATKFREGAYKNGRKIGVWITYYKDGVTPRLIGEYKDNRPAGAYFRFDKTGQLAQAGSLKKIVTTDNSVQINNPVFSCKLFFENYDMVAGQVFFAKHVIQQENTLQFWTESSLQTISSTSKKGDYTWLDNNYDQILMAYLQIRTPNKFKVPLTPIAVAENTQVSSNAKLGNYFLPPTVKQPIRVGKGFTFMPNGFNKLYTEDNEIWMDGQFTNGQLGSGKVFIYDRDGVLLKVRVYKDGKYESDGVL